MSYPSDGSIMKMIYLTTILIIYFTTFGFGFPTKPLNERPPDQTWEAWLLVDENQNHNRHAATNSDGTLRRRITPKSVFIAPTFSPESLPACADGYSSDPMGRCIKIIKLDEEAHYDFIIKNLEDKFGSLDYEDEEQVDEIMETSQGPLQFNIPLNLDKDDSKDDFSEEETDVAIVVSPTKPIFDIKQYNFNKRDSLVDEQRQEMLLKKLVPSTSHTTAKTTTIITSETTTNFTEEEVPSTTFENKETTTVIEVTKVTDDSLKTWKSTELDNETSTITESTTESSTTTHTVTDSESTLTTASAGRAVTDSTVTTVSDPVVTVTTDPVVTITTDPVVTVTTDPVVTLITDRFVSEYRLTTQSPKPVEIQSDVRFDLTSVYPLFEPTTSSPKPEVTTRSHVRFPDQEISHQNVEKTFVRFPDTDITFQSQLSPSMGTREVQDFEVPGFYRQKQSENPLVFRDNIPSSGDTSVDNVPSKAVRWEFNRRNRDKNSSVFMLPPRWNPNTFQKPLVLRFSRKHAFMDNNEFKSPAYYRSIPSDDFAYLFKFKQKRIRR